MPPTKERTMEEDHTPQEDETNELDDVWQDPLSREFAQAKDRVTLRCIKSDFVTAVGQYRALLQEYLPRVGSDEELRLEFHRRIIEEILTLAYQENEPFETCQRVWNEMLQVGFSTIECRCLMTHFFVKCCIRSTETDIGFSVLDPLIADVERLRAEPTATKQEVDYYDYELESLNKLRSRLEIERG